MLDLQHHDSPGRETGPSCEAQRWANRQCVAYCSGGTGQRSESQYRGPRWNVLLHPRIRSRKRRNRRKKGTFEMGSKVDGRHFAVGPRVFRRPATRLFDFLHFPNIIAPPRHLTSMGTSSLPLTVLPQHSTSAVSIARPSSWARGGMARCPDSQRPPA